MTNRCHLRCYLHVIDSGSRTALSEKDCEFHMGSWGDSAVSKGVGAGAHELCARQADLGGNQSQRAYVIYYGSKTS